MRLSPSSTLIARRGTSKRRAIVVAASGSVGATIAPNAKQTAQSSPSTSACAVTATAAAVATTSSVEFSVIVRRSARSSRRFAKNAPEYRSGGRKTTSTSAAASATSGTPGRTPSASPPSTSRIGYGTPIRVAVALSTATATRRLMITASMWFMGACPRMMLKRVGRSRDGWAMTTLCRAYTTESDARVAVDRLLLARVPGEDITVFAGAVERDVCDTVTTYPGGVARVCVGRRDGLERILVAAGREPAAAAADVRALDAGRILVLATRAGI